MCVTSQRRQRLPLDHRRGALFGAAWPAGAAGHDQRALARTAECAISRRRGAPRLDPSTLRAAAGSAIITSQPAMVKLPLAAPPRTRRLVSAGRPAASGASWRGSRLTARSRACHVTHWRRDGSDVIRGRGASSTGVSARERRPSGRARSAGGREHTPAPASAAMLRPAGLDQSPVSPLRWPGHGVADAHPA